MAEKHFSRWMRRKGTEGFGLIKKRNSMCQSIETEIVDPIKSTWPALEEASRCELVGRLVTPFQGGPKYKLQYESLVFKPVVASEFNFTLASYKKKTV